MGTVSNKEVIPLGVGWERSRREWGVGFKGSREYYLPLRNLQKDEGVQENEELKVTLTFRHCLNPKYIGFGSTDGLECLSPRG